MRTVLPTRRVRLAAAALALAALSGCAVVPEGPSTMALPGTGRSFPQFRADDDACRRFANERIGGKSAQRAAQDTVAGGAVAGAAIGAVAGAAIGGSQGAGVGAGVGLLTGTAVGSGAATGSAIDVQRRYDHAYVQCMYASGHKVPVIDGYRPGSWAPPAPPVPRSSAPSAAPPAPPSAAPVSPSAPPAAGPSTAPSPPPGAPPPPPPTWRSG